MSEPFLSEIRMFSFQYAPRNWARCDGQLLPINQNQALFSLLGTTYGGNGQTNFALPNLRGRIPIHRGSGHTLGEAAGSEAVTIGMAQMPTHMHFMAGNTAVTGNAVNATQGAPVRETAVGSGVFVGTYWANSGKLAYSTSDPDSAMSPATVSNVGGSQAHENRSPYLVINFCIALIGVFPSPN